MIELIDLKSNTVIETFDSKPQGEYYNVVTVDDKGNQEGQWRQAGWSDGKYSLVEVPDPVVDTPVTKPVKIDLPADVRIDMAMARLGVTLTELNTALKAVQ